MEFEYENVNVNKPLFLMIPTDIKYYQLSWKQMLNLPCPITLKHILLLGGQKEAVFAQSNWNKEC